MSLPALSATSGNHIRDGIYTIARTAADPATHTLTVTLEAPQDALEKAVVARRAADKAAILAAAVVDYRLGELQRAIVAFGVKVFGHYGSRTDAQYLRIFPISPSLIATCNPSDRVTSFGALRKAAVDPATAKELAPAVKLVVAAIDDWTAGAAAATKADEGLKAASKAESDAADAWQTAVRKLRGQIIVLFPRDAPRQRSYFPATKPARKPKSGGGGSDGGTGTP